MSKFKVVDFDVAKRFFPLFQFRSGTLCNKTEYKRGVALALSRTMKLVLSLS